MAPKRLKENPSDVEDNVQDAFLRGLEAERFLVKNMRRKVKYFLDSMFDNLFLLKGKFKLLLVRLTK